MNNQILFLKMYLACIFVLAYGISFCSANTEGQLLELEVFVQSQFAENENMKSRVAELEGEVATLVAENLEEEFETKSGELKGVETMAEKEELPKSEHNGFSGHLFTRAAGSSWAFHAYRSRNRCYNSYETIEFDVETIDNVGMYDPRDGIAEPPVSGVYVFTWTVAAPHQTKFATELVIDGRMAGVITTDSDATQSSGSGTHPATAVVVAQVNAGSHCYIRMRSGTGDCANVLSDDNIVRTTFSSWQLF
ncbi:uncharacterized protein LOC123540848 [Mercenaria mercenaria]|uniref:uncharacterized protein LOC123540848 n=1 Tax=Mercenaria mercenaria TaxID=6596 RepID=UPI00234F8380|nr:uncharacterized protein LOC123540848 [Mercenaria mercenaria]